MSYPRVWTELASQDHRVSRRLVAALERARGLPVRLMFHVDCRGRDVSPLTLLFLQHLRCHLEHIEVLRITIWTNGPASSEWRVLDALAYPAPMITQLVLVLIKGLTQDYESLPQLRENLFAGFAPRLTRLLLHNVLLRTMNRVPQPIPALSNVNFLRMSLHACRVPALHSLHAGLPNLTEYELQYETVFSKSHHDMQTPAPMHAHLLRTIRVLSPTPDFTFLPYTVCARFSMESPPWAIDEELWRGRAPPTRVAVLDWHFGAADDAGAYRMTKTSAARPIAHTADRLRFAAPYLRALVVDCLQPASPAAIRTLALPDLRYLHVVCAPDRPLPTWLRTPALALLRVSVPTAGLSARRLSEFINRLACARDEVFLEMDGDGHGDGLQPEKIGAGLKIPTRFVRCAAKTGETPPLPKFVPEMGSERWDDKMVDVLDRIRDI